MAVRINYEKREATGFELLSTILTMKFRRFTTAFQRKGASVLLRNMKLPTVNKIGGKKKEEAYN